MMDLLRNSKCNKAAKASGKFTCTVHISFSGVFLLVLENDMKCRGWSCILMAKIAEFTYGDWSPTLPLVTEWQFRQRNPVHKLIVISISCFYSPSLKL